MACALAPLFCLFSVLWTSDAHAIRDGYLSGKPTVIPVSAHASRATRFDRVGIAEALGARVKQLKQTKAGPDNRRGAWETSA